MEIQELRDKAFSWFQTKINKESRIEINQRLVDLNPIYEKHLNAMSWEQKRDIILDCEYNYIMQASEQDLLTVYK